MRKITATTPDGTAWTVRVVWQPRWKALARRFGGWRRKRRDSSSLLDGVDVPTGGGGGGHHGGGGVLDSFFDDIVIAIVVISGLVVAGALFWWVLLPLLLLALDAIVVVVLLALAIPARVLLRRPWTVEAVRRAAGGGEWFATEVVGWREALRTRDEIADKIRLGYPAPVVGSLQRR